MSDKHVIFHPIKKQYWQCGMWVDHRIQATKYPNYTEALSVIAIRKLHDAEARPL